jgi:hypothetical protein
MNTILPEILGESLAGASDVSLNGTEGERGLM